MCPTKWLPLILSGHIFLHIYSRTFITFRDKKCNMKSRLFLCYECRVELVENDQLMLV